MGNNSKWVNTVLLYGYPKYKETIEYMVAEMSDTLFKNNGANCQDCLSIHFYLFIYIYCS